ncbi:MAG: hypothetical protein Q7T62_12320 [Undibacterium sp.]|nr:hypothetical protein [Undibacterium sp.]
MNTYSPQRENSRGHQADDLLSRASILTGQVLQTASTLENGVVDL